MGNTNKHQRNVEPAPPPEVPKEYTPDQLLGLILSDQHWGSVKLLDSYHNTSWTFSWNGNRRRFSKYPLVDSVLISYDETNKSFTILTNVGHTFVLSFVDSKTAKLVVENSGGKVFLMEYQVGEISEYELPVPPRQTHQPDEKTTPLSFISG